MKLPNYKNAIIDKEKLTEYCLNEDHPIGKHKARVFKSVLGITAANFELLIQIIFEGIQTYQAIKKETDQYGTRFYVDSVSKKTPISSLRLSEKCSSRLSRDSAFSNFASLAMH